MNNYISNTIAEQEEMLRVLGVDSIDGLFGDIPGELRLKSGLGLPDAMSEPELHSHMKAIAGQNISCDTHVCFMGGGIYDHFIPSVIHQIAGRQEFYTAYTPYQAEISQGTLQTIFEYQSMICRLTGMDVSNASLYDCATACAEAMVMANSINGRTDVVLAGQLNPQYMKVCETYSKYRGFNIIKLNCDPQTGAVPLESLAAAVTDNCAAVFVQNPNFFGIFEDLEMLGKAAKRHDALFVAVVDPISLGILEPPAAFGADIVVGEGQALGNPMNFGGPGFGFFACKKEYMRKMPGRIAGLTTDTNGKRGFILTLQAREQHIRREKATSNICTNQALCALMATVYMSAMGKTGIKKVASLCVQKSHYMFDKLIETGKFEKRFTAPFFKEFVLKYTGGDIEALHSALLSAGFMPGITLAPSGNPRRNDGTGNGNMGSGGSGLEGCLLIAVTEKRTKAEIDAYVAVGADSISARI